MWRQAWSRIGSSGRLEFDDGKALQFNDMRKFGTWHLVFDEREAWSDSGPDALSEEFNDAWLIARLKGRGASVKSLLLDQRIAAGVGNIYADEALRQVEAVSLTFAMRECGRRTVRPARHPNRHRVVKR